MTTRLVCALLALAIGLSVTGCGQGGSPVATTPEAAPAGRYVEVSDEERERRWDACMRREIEHLDDLTSDARTVAHAAMARCRQHQVSRVDSRGRADPYDLDRRSDRATAMVLERRAAQRRGRPARNP